MHINFWIFGQFCQVQTLSQSCQDIVGEPPLQLCERNSVGHTFASILIGIPRHWY